MIRHVSATDNAPNSESSEPAKGLGDLLANFALGPAWAKAGGDEKKKFRSHDGEGGGRGRDGKRRRDGAGGGGKFDSGRGQQGGRRFAGNRDDGGARRDFRRDDEFTPPAAGVSLMLVPDATALHLIVKEVHQVARVYSLFDIASTLLADRRRCRAVFEVDENHDALWCGKLDDSLFITRAEAAAHLWKSRELRDRFLDEETVEVDPPSGNFVAVARCGISGEWLGPPNFHTYQPNLRRLHRERFSNMPFDAYNARVRTERGEEAVNAWLESMKVQTRWRLKSAEGDEGAWISNIADATRALGEAVFDEAFESTKRADVPASIVGGNLSPGLLITLKRSGGHTRKHPAMLIPAICKALEAEHLPVFKRKGKLYTGPARPLALPAGAVLAERPSRMVEWIRANTPAKLEGLWQAVLPEGGTAPPAEYAADLFWMLQQGHILLFTDDMLVVQEHHEPPVKKAPKKKAEKAARSMPANDRVNKKEPANAVSELPLEGEAPVAMSRSEESPKKANKSEASASDAQPAEEETSDPRMNPPAQEKAPDEVTDEPPHEVAPTSESIVEETAPEKVAAEEPPPPAP